MSTKPQQIIQSVSNEVPRSEEKSDEEASTEEEETKPFILSGFEKIIYSVKQWDAFPLRAHNVDDINEVNKHVLLAIISFLLCTSFALIWISAFIIDARRNREYAPTDSLSSHILSFSAIILVISLVSFVFILCGFVGVFREHIILIRIFYIALIVLLSLKLAIALFTFSFTGAAESLAGSLLGDKLILNYRASTDIEATMDYLQIKFRCCGLREQGFKDWNRSIYFNCSDDNPSTERCGVPWSCCRNETGFNNALCGMNVQKVDRNLASRAVYTKGCIIAILEWTIGHAFLVGFLLLLETLFLTVLIFQSTHLVNELQMMNGVYRGPWWLWIGEPMPDKRQPLPQGAAHRNHRPVAALPFHLELAWHEPLNPADQLITAVHQGNPAVHQGNPAVHQGNPAVHQGIPAVDQWNPAVDQGSPAVDQWNPAVDQGSPAVDQWNPVVHQWNPAGDQWSPAVDQGSRAVDQQEEPPTDPEACARHQQRRSTVGQRFFRAVMSRASRVTNRRQAMSTSEEECRRRSSQAQGPAGPVTDSVVHQRARDAGGSVGAADALESVGEESDVEAVELNMVQKAPLPSIGTPRDAGGSVGALESVREESDVEAVELNMVQKAPLPSIGARSTQPEAQRTADVNPVEHIGQSHGPAAKQIQDPSDLAVTKTLVPGLIPPHNQVNLPNVHSQLGSSKQLIGIVPEFTEANQIGRVHPVQNHREHMHDEQHTTGASSSSSPVPTSHPAVPGDAARAPTGREERAPAAPPSRQPAAAAPADVSPHRTASAAQPGPVDDAATRAGSVEDATAQAKPGEEPLAGQERGSMAGSDTGQQQRQEMVSSDASTGTHSGKKGKKGHHRKHHKKKKKGRVAPAEETPTTGTSSAAAKQMPTTGTSGAAAKQMPTAGTSGAAAEETPISGTSGAVDEPLHEWLKPNPPKETGNEVTNVDTGSAYFSPSEFQHLAVRQSPNHTDETSSDPSSQRRGSLATVISRNLHEMMPSLSPASPAQPQRQTSDDDDHHMPVVRAASKSRLRDTLPSFGLLSGGFSEPAPSAPRAQSPEPSAPRAQSPEPSAPRAQSPELEEPEPSAPRAQSPELVDVPQQGSLRRPSDYRVLETPESISPADPPLSSPEEEEEEEGAESDSNQK